MDATIIKQKIPLFLLTLIFLLFHGCDNGLQYAKMRIATLPEKIVYDSSYDQALSFEGGMVELETIDGTKELIPLQVYAYQNEERKDTGRISSAYISSDVNFAVPGTYTVTVWQTKELYCQFNVIVQ